MKLFYLIFLALLCFGEARIKKRLGHSKTNEVLFHHGPEDEADNIPAFSISTTLKLSTIKPGAPSALDKDILEDASNPNFLDILEDKIKVSLRTGAQDFPADDVRVTTMGDDPKRFAARYVILKAVHAGLVGEKIDPENIKGFVEQADVEFFQSVQETFTTGNPTKHQIAKILLISMKWNRLRCLQREVQVVGELQRVPTTLTYTTGKMGNHIFNQGAMGSGVFSGFLATNAINLNLYGRSAHVNQIPAHCDRYNSGYFSAAQSSMNLLGPLINELYTTGVIGKPEAKAMLTEALKWYVRSMYDTVAKFVFWSGHGQGALTADNWQTADRLYDQLLAASPTMANDAIDALVVST
jgi:hypothetical protein